MPKYYLGDGVYMAYDGFDLVLTTENGVRVTNRIVLEPEVLAALVAILTKLQAPQSRAGT